VGHNERALDEVSIVDQYYTEVLLLSSLPVRHWRAYTKGLACTRYLPKVTGA